jgi:hypothetical protein
MAYRTKNIILAVMDGARWSETFGDETKKICPHLHNDLAPLGTNFTDCQNAGQTITRQGHSTIISGTWQRMQLQGPRLNMPSLFEYYRDETGAPAESCWSIFGKGLYAFEQPSSHPGYGEPLGGYHVCGEYDAPFNEHSLAGDEQTTDVIINTMMKYTPRLLFLNWGFPDCAGHRLNGGIEQYQEAVSNCDKQFMRLWEFVQTHNHYRDQTTVVFLNDHGRSSEDWSRHGVPNDECAHCMCLWIGPDTPVGKTVDARVYLTDIAPTAAELLGIQTPLATGRILQSALTRYQVLNTFIPQTATAARAVGSERLARRDDLEEQVAIYALEHSWPLAARRFDFGLEMLVTGLVRYSHENYVPKQVKRRIHDQVANWFDRLPYDGITNIGATTTACLTDVQAGRLAPAMYHMLCDEGLSAVDDWEDDEAARYSSIELLRAAVTLAALRSQHGEPVDCPQSVELFERAIKKPGVQWHPIDRLEWQYRLAQLQYYLVDSAATDVIRQHYISTLLYLLETNPEVGMLWMGETESAMNCLTFKLGLLRRPPGQVEFWRGFHLAARAHYRAADKKFVDYKLGPTGYMTTRHIRILSRRGAQHMVERLRYLVDQDGKFGDGSPLAQGAFLSTFNRENWRYGGPHPYVNRIDPDDVEEETRATAPWEIV